MSTTILPASRKRPRSPAATLIVLPLLLALAVGGAVWAATDYRAWLSLGRGGLPANPFGWGVASYFRIRSNDPLDVSTLIEGGGERAMLKGLTPRSGPRPRMAAWPIPNRQLDQPMGAGVRIRLSDIFDATAAGRREIDYRLSHFEKRNQALTLRDAAGGHADAARSHGEIAHMHDDGSMHMIFSHPDGRTVIENGWGERHPAIGVLKALPLTYLYVYPPRDEAELAVVERLLAASVAHMATAPGHTASVETGL